MNLTTSDELHLFQLFQNHFKRFSICLTALCQLRFYLIHLFKTSLTH